MLEDPLQNEQNAQRILQIWQPLIKSFRQSPADQLKPKLLALCNSFCMAARALELQTGDVNSEHHLVHKAMAAMPANVVHLIALEAGLIWDEPDLADKPDVKDEADEQDVGDEPDVGDKPDVLDEQKMQHGHVMVCAWHAAYGNLARIQPPSLPCHWAYWQPCNSLRCLCRARSMDLVCIFATTRRLMKSSILCCKICYVQVPIHQQNASCSLLLSMLDAHIMSNFWRSTTLSVIPHINRFLH